MLESFDIANWSGPFDDATRARALGALEKGAVLFFPNLAFPLAENEKPFLNPALSDGKAKNISFDHASGKLQGTSATGDEATRLCAMIARFGADAGKFVTALLPGYAGLERARTSYRPVEVEGRAYSALNDDRLLHIDAFPSRPMQQGRRILRFFANVAPPHPQGQGSRHWKVGENFADFAQKFAPHIKPHFPGKSALLRALHVTHGRRSAYDEMMLSLHDAAKLDAAFQKNSPQSDVTFPPGSCWLVYTDQVLHAALGGAFALEQTFHLDIARMAEPNRAPIRVLEKITGRKLA